MAFIDRFVKELVGGGGVSIHNEYFLIQYALGLIYQPNFGYCSCLLAE